MGKVTHLRNEIYYRIYQIRVNGTIMNYNRAHRELRFSKV